MGPAALLTPFGALLARPGPAAVFALNLLPVALAALFGWSAAELMLLYWVENVVIGVFNVAKMAASAVAGGGFGLSVALVLIPFFCVHYGLFCLGHGFFVLELGGAPSASSSLLAPVEAALRLLQTDDAFFWNVAAIVAGQALAMALDWWPRRASIDPRTQMYAPYGRIVALHLALLGGLGFVAAIGQPMAAVLLLALGKAVLELAAQAGRAGQSASSAGAASSGWLSRQALMSRALPATSPPGRRRSNRQIS